MGNWYEISQSRYPADIAHALEDDDAAIGTLRDYGIDVNFGRVAICCRNGRPFSLRDAAILLAADQNCSLPSTDLLSSAEFSGECEWAGCWDRTSGRAFFRRTDGSDRVVEASLCNRHLTEHWKLTNQAEMTV